MKKRLGVLMKRFKFLEELKNHAYTVYNQNE